MVFLQKKVSIVIIKNIYTTLLILAAISCSPSNGNARNAEDHVCPTQFDFDFSDGRNDFVPMFADYPEYTNGYPSEPFYELDARIVQRPIELGSWPAFKVSGNNHSDDLFMLLSRKITGLKPNQLYDVTFTVELASNALLTDFGIGGGPGSSVYLKVGAINTEPAREVIGSDWRFTFDAGSQSVGGSDMITIGTIGMEGSGYQLLVRDSSDISFQLETDGSGDAWIMVGTDSGFEGLTTLYYTKLKTTFQPVLTDPMD
jgi:hypothetical protein